MPLTLSRPREDEFGPYYGKYLCLISTDDARPALEDRCRETLAMVGGLGDQRALERYAPGKWSIKETLGHVCDVERVMSYRALRLGRGDRTPLPGFDENLYVPNSRADRRPLAGLCAELSALRESTLALIRGFDEEALMRRGEASGQPFSVRALLWVIAGHEIHHANLLRDRYGLAAAPRAAGVKP
ncbi:MAG: DinB family protein [Candidatus Eisenbacteria bacterium]|nr:DinB family protein [Candidatus Eisenbacteria bacterium]